MAYVIACILEQKCSPQAKLRKNLAKIDLKIQDRLSGRLGANHLKSENNTQSHNFARDEERNNNERKAQSSYGTKQLGVSRSIDFNVGS